MRIVIDLDGTLCPLRDENQKYSQLQPLPGAVQKLKQFKEDGHYIIIQTARNMATQQSNLGRVMKNIGKDTLEWLEKHDIPYDEIYFGKPNAHLYIDDRSLRFEGWDAINEDLLLKLSKAK